MRCQSTVQNGSKATAGPIIASCIPAILVRNATVTAQVVAMPHAFELHLENCETLSREGPKTSGTNRPGGAHVARHEATPINLKLNRT